MRDILFRAKAINRNKGEHRTKYKNGDWVYGLITRPYNDMFPVLPMEFRNENGVDGIEVDYKTVGQFTGLTDKNGKKIFEGDIVYIKSQEPTSKVTGRKPIYTIIFKKGYFSLLRKTNRIVVFDLRVWYKECEVIGNIYDNPELLKEIQNGDNT